MSNDWIGLLRLLTKEGVEFAVVGGTAAVLHGSSAATYDLDILSPFTRSNCERLLNAISGIHPRLSHTPDKRPVRLGADELSSFRNLYLLTDLGRLDVLGELPPLSDAGAAIHRSDEMEIRGMKIRVLSLEDLITVKAAMTRPKDKLVEAEMRAVLDARRAREP